MVKADLAKPVTAINLVEKIGSLWDSGLQKQLNQVDVYREPISTLTWQYSDVQGQVSQVTAGPYNPSLPQLSQFPTKTTWTSWSDSFVMVHVTYVTCPRNSKPHGRYGFYLHVYGDPAAVIYQVPYGAICHGVGWGMIRDRSPLKLFKRLKLTQENELKTHWHKSWRVQTKITKIDGAEKNEGGRRRKKRTENLKGPTFHLWGQNFVFFLGIYTS